VMDFLLESASAEGGGDAEPLAAVSSLQAIAEVFGAVGSLAAQGARESVFKELDESKVSRFLAAALQTGISQGESGRLTAIWSMSAYAKSSSTALESVLSDADLLDLWLNMRNLRIVGKAACIRSVAAALKGSGAEDDAELQKLRSLRQRLLVEAAQRNGRDDLMAFAMAELRAPVPEVRCAVYQLMAAIAAQRGDAWGVRLLTSHLDFWQLMKDRSTEPSKDCQEWKFAVLEAMSRNNEGAQALQGSQAEDLAEELRRGPFVGNARMGEMETL